MADLVVLALTVFFAWEAAARPVVAYVTDAWPAAWSNFAKCVVVALMARAVLLWPFPTLYVPMAAAGLVALLSAFLRRMGDGGQDRVAMVRRSSRGMPRPGN